MRTVSFPIVNLYSLHNGPRLSLRDHDLNKFKSIHPEIHASKKFLTFLANSFLETNNIFSQYIINIKFITLTPRIRIWTDFHLPYLSVLSLKLKPFWSIDFWEKVFKIFIYKPVFLCKNVTPITWFKQNWISYQRMVLHIIQPFWPIGFAEKILKGFLVHFYAKMRPLLWPHLMPRVSWFD